MRISACIVLLALAGCGSSRAPERGRAHGTPVLRAVYRDATHRLLVVLPDHVHPGPHGDCAAPVLIDEVSGAARQITPADAAQWIKRMELSGAVQGTCP